MNHINAQHCIILQVAHYSKIKTSDLSNLLHFLVMEAERNITLKTIKLSGFKCTGHKQEEVTIFWKEFFILKD